MTIHYLYNRLQFILIALSFLVILSINSYSSDNQKPRNNISILDSLSKVSASKICDYLKSKSIDSIQLTIAKNPAQWLLKNSLVDLQIPNKLRFFQNDSVIITGIPRIELAVTNISVKYSSIEDVDSLIREFNITIIGTLINKKNELISVPQINEKYSDKISVYDILIVKSNQYDFANGQLPLKEKTFFEEYAEPFIVVTTAFVATSITETVSDVSLAA